MAVTDKMLRKSFSMAKTAKKIDKWKAAQVPIASKALHVPTNRMSVFEAWPFPWPKIWLFE